MSENNLPNINPQKEPEHDFSDRDLVKINQYLEEGLPGITKMDDEKIYRMMDLYLGGKTYHQISSIMRLDRRVILYLSQKFNWFSHRAEFLYEIEHNQRKRIMETKIASKDFLMQLTHMWEKKIGNKISQFLSTGNEEKANEIDLKEIDRYMKAIDLLHKFSDESSGSGKGPAVGLNLGDGVTVKKVGNSIEITPKQKAIGDVLKQYADFKREEENKLRKPEKPDINIESSSNTGETDED